MASRLKWCRRMLSLLDEPYSLSLHPKPIKSDEMDGRMMRGKKGEELARVYLEQNGFHILHVHWQAGHKELDIVAERGKMLHVVEVRSRTEPCLVEPPQTVQYEKQRNVISAARSYIYKYRIDKEVQFDIISVIFEPDETKIEYIPNAFYPYYR